MAAALLLVLFRGNMEVGSQSQTTVTSNADNTAGWEKAHGARDDPKAASFRRARNAPWAALADCIMPPNLFGHTESSLHTRQAAVAGVASSRDPFHEL